MGSPKAPHLAWRASLSTIARPELALQDSSYETRRIKMPTSSCILALEKMRGWLSITGEETELLNGGIGRGHRLDRALFLKLAGGLAHSVGVGEPDEVILLEAHENAPHGRGAVGRSDYEWMDSDDDRRRLQRRVRAGLGSELQNVIEPQRLDLPRSLHPRELLAHVDGDHRIGQQRQRPI